GGYECRSGIHIDWPGLFAPIGRKRTRNVKPRCGGTAPGAGSAAPAAWGNVTGFQGCERRPTQYHQAGAELVGAAMRPGARSRYLACRCPEPIAKAKRK